MMQSKSSINKNIIKALLKVWQAQSERTTVRVVCSGILSGKICILLLLSEASTCIIASTSELGSRAQIGSFTWFCLQLQNRGAADHRVFGSVASFKTHLFRPACGRGLCVSTWPFPSAGDCLSIKMNFTYISSSFDFIPVIWMNKCFSV